jgi:hypothetical protein
MDHDDDPLRDRRGIDFEEMEEFAREMRDLLGSLDLSDEQRRAVEARTAHPIRRNRSGSRVSTVEDKREVNTALHHHPAFNPKYERDSSNDSIENEKLKLENKKAQAQLTLPKLTRTGTAGSTRPEGQRFCRGDRKHGGNESSGGILRFG